MRTLLEGRLAYAAEMHPSVWMAAFDQPRCARVMASFLNYQDELPPVPVPVRFSLRPPARQRFHSLRSVPDGRATGFSLDADGVLRATLDKIEMLAMVVVEYQQI